MVRKLKHHEQKLLRKVDLITYKSDQSHRAATVCRRYAIQNPSDYDKYNRICGNIRKLAHTLSLLPPTSPFRSKYTTLLLTKLYDMGLLSTPAPTTSLTSATAPASNLLLSAAESKISVSRFCRRRIGVVMTALGMVGGGGALAAANKFVEQGHVRVGTEVVLDTAFLVVRAMEDYVTWVDGSKVKRQARAYRGEVDDFDEGG